MAVVFACLCTRSFAQAEPHNLRCEYLVNPIGIDAPQPRLTWQIRPTTTYGLKQTAFRIIIGVDSASVAAGKGMLYDSKKKTSSGMLAPVTGIRLLPFTKYYWSVQLWDEKDKPSAKMPLAFFETGMMEARNWKGSWITDRTDVNYKPAAYFRKAFSAVKKIRTARAYIAVGGLYELYINGNRVGDHRLDPVYTRFDRRTVYVAHDVTAFLQQGGNAIGVLLGNGWFNHQSTAVWNFDKAPWRARPKFCMDLRIQYDDGSIETISTDNDWKTSTGPLIFNSIYTAEHYDARKEIAGWNTFQFKDSSWRWVTQTGAPSANIVSQQMHPIRETKLIKPVSIRRIDSLTWIFDIGRNIAGVSELRVRGKEGTVVRLVHAERLDSMSRADQSNINLHYRPTDDTDPFATDIFILSGSKEDVFKPKFNYKGFQFIEVRSSQPLDLTKENLTAWFMHSDVPVAGRINSSDTLLNKIWQATNNSYLSNLYGYPTDCPQREKNGWTGDAHIASETGMYNFDAITVYEKWLADHWDEQQPNGVLPAIIPTGGWGYDWANGTDWTSSIAIIPWNVYLFYGDLQLLAKSYEHIRRYVDYIDHKYSSGLTDWGLGDWIPIKSVANKELTSSIYFFADANILAKAAKLLGKTAEYKKYAALAQKIRNSINAKFLDKQTGMYANGLQTELSAPLYWGIVPPELAPLVAANLSKKVQQDGGMDVGLLGSKTLLNALSEHGYAEQAYAIASQQTYPSWGWWIKNGATTLYENWRIEGKNDISLNHIMFGEIGAWYYKALGGIFPDTAQPGFKHVILRPNFIDRLASFHAEHEGPYGKIVSAWRKDGEGITYSITIPPNSTATLYLDAQHLIMKRREGNVWKAFLQQQVGEFVGSKYKIELVAGVYEIEVSRAAN
ncbi:MAG: family 78 glycoside hydrolase catalytic domain [Chitinophagaceae bacterium]